MRTFKKALLPAACMAALLAGVMPAQAQSQDRWIAQFDRLDVNRDGFLSHAELEPLQIQGTDTYSAQPRRGGWQASFRRLDTNGDGFLSRSEADALVQAHPGSSFAQFDTNRDGYISMSEAQPWMAAVNVQYGVPFAQLDTDRDGFISRSEASVLFRGPAVASAVQPPHPAPAPDAVGVAPVPPLNFQAMDLNRDGFVSRSEAATHLGPGGAMAAFDRYDSNRDGFLSPAEAELMVRDRYANIR
jgi:hypothetical protein